MEQTNHYPLFSYEYILQWSFMNFCTLGKIPLVVGTTKLLRSFYQELNIKMRLLIGDCNGTWTHKRLVCNRILNRLAKLTKWRCRVVRTYLYGALTLYFYWLKPISLILRTLNDVKTSSRDVLFARNLSKTKGSPILLITLQEVYLEPCQIWCRYFAKIVHGF